MISKSSLQLLGAKVYGTRISCFNWGPVNVRVFKQKLGASDAQDRMRLTRSQRLEFTSFPSRAILASPTQ